MHVSTPSKGFTTRTGRKPLEVSPASAIAAVIIVVGVPFIVAAATIQWAF